MISTKNALLVLVVVAVLVIGGQFLGRSNGSGSSAEPKTREFVLKVEHRKITSGPSTLSVSEGDFVTIHLTVDEDEELHLHGYDRSIDLTKGEEGTLSFTASASGRFPFELEKSKTELGALEVQP